MAIRTELAGAEAKFEADATWQVLLHESEGGAGKGLHAEPGGAADAGVVVVATIA
jgi:hypothetical protein